MIRSTERRRWCAASILAAWALLLIHWASAVSAADAGTPIRVACIGDSITYGADIPDRVHASYPAQLGVLLGTGYVVGNFGESGATLLTRGDKPYVQQGAFAAALDFQPDIVVIKLSTNDSKPWNWAHQAEFRRDYIALIRRFRKLRHKPDIWIAYPAPAFSSSWGISSSVIQNEIIPLIDEVAAHTGVKIIDLNSPLRDKRHLFPDDIHPNAQGAGVIAAIVAEVIGKSAARPKS